MLVLQGGQYTIANPAESGHPTGIMLTPITDGLWDAQTTIKFAGVKMRSRTTIAELSSGGLFVTHPDAWTPSSARLWTNSDQCGFSH